MVKQNTPEWLELRKTKIGASDAPIIMGVSPWKTPYELWQLKSGIVPDEKTNRYQQRGHDLEEAALLAYNEYTGNNAAPRVCFSPHHAWMMASLDGYDLKNRMIVEIKCPGEKDHAIAMRKKVPEKYFPQLQHQLAVTGLDMLHYWSFSEQSRHLVEVCRDDNFIKEMINRESVFYRSMVEGVPPELTDRDYVQRKDLEFFMAEQRFYSAKQKLEKARDEELEARKYLIKLSDGHSSAGAMTKVRKVIRKGSVDYSKVPELMHVNLDDYRASSSQSWRITLTD